MTLPKLTKTSKEIFIGIDVHKKTYHITILDSERRKLQAKSLPACAESFITFLQRNYKSYAIYSAYEAGFSGFDLHRKLVKKGINNIVFNPASLPVALNSKVKTDKLDSFKIADSLALRLLSPIYVPSVQAEASRTLSRTRKQLVELKVSTSNQIKSKLYEFGYIDASDSSKFSLKWVNSILSNSSIPKSIKLAINAQIQVYKGICTQILELEKQMDADLEKNRAEEAKIVQSIPGVGPVSAHIILNEIGTICRFTSIKKIYSYTGLTPCEYSSGEKQKMGKITRQGNSRLRWCLTEVSWRAIQRDPSLREIYERLKFKVGGKKAIVAVARRLIGRIRACLLNRQAYQIAQPEAA